MAKKSSRLWLILLSFLVGGLVCAGVLNAFRPPPETVYLPGETVEVEIVPQNFLEKLAATSSLNERLSYENGQLRDENGRLLRLVQRLKAVTPEVPEPEIITRTIMPDCPGAPARTYRASVDAYLFEGLNPAGEYTQGWRGEILCEVRTEATEWLPLVKKPFSMSHVVAQTIVPPSPPERPLARWYTGLQYSLISSTQRTPFDYNLVASFEASKFRAYGGRVWFPKKRHQIRTGIFVDSDSSGVDLSISF